MITMPLGAFSRPAVRRAASSIWTRGGSGSVCSRYSRRHDLINVFSWPAGEPPSPPAISAQQGYHLVRWVSDGVEYWAASDLGIAELKQFVSLFSGS